MCCTVERTVSKVRLSKVGRQEDTQRIGEEIWIDRRGGGKKEWRKEGGMKKDTILKFSAT